jgi:hypothetical protein
MAEAIGLALGTIALASLFTTCVELLDYFELGRTHEYDLGVASLKLALLRARLDSWGDELNVRQIGHESEALRHVWPQEQDVISGSLLGIKNILGNAEALKDKYKLIPRKPNGISALVPGRRGLHVLNDPQSSPPERPRSHRTQFLRRSTKWAIKDKQKFDNLLKDLEFFISNLELVVNRMNMSRSNRDGNRGQPNHGRQQPDSSTRQTGEPMLLDSDDESTLFLDENEHSPEIRSQREEPPHRDGFRRAMVNGNEYIVENQENQSLLNQAITNDSARSGARSGTGTSFTVRNMRDQATAIQGPIDDRKLDKILADRQQIIFGLHGRMTEPSRSVFQGQGQRLGSSTVQSATGR